MISAELIADLVRDEGIRFKPYTDTTGHVSIGIGRNLADRGISADEMSLMFKNDVEMSVEETLKKWPWVGELDSVRRDVVFNMSFNMGIPVLSQFKRTLASIRDSRYIDASMEMLESKWASQVGSRALRLSLMMKTGRRA